MLPHPSDAILPLKYHHLIPPPMFGSKKDPNEQIFKDACKAYKKEDYNKAAELFSDAAAGK